MPDPQPRPEDAARCAAALLRPAFEGRRFLHFGGTHSMLAAEAAEYRRLGAGFPFLLADSDDTGATPPPEAGERATVPVRGADIVDHLRVLESALDALPATVLEALHRWDPDGAARALPRIALQSRTAVAGRRLYGGRRPGWNSAEDKTRVDALLDAAGVARPPSAVLPAEEGEALRAAAARLDRGGGTVWTADSADGLRGGAIGLLRARDGAGAAEVARTMAARYRGRLVRVTPFLEGIPCSIHGLVFPGTTAALRPVEMLTFRRGSDGGFVYGGCANGWDPAPADREAMRTAARRAGEALRRHLGFRGAFTLDGVMAEEGFLPTEINARPGAGLVLYARALPHFPVWPLCTALAEGEDVAWMPRAHGEALTAAADERRAGWCAVPVDRPRTARSVEVVESGGAWRVAAEGEVTAGRVAVTPSPWGGILRFTPVAGSIPAGPSFAPRALAALRAGAAALGVPLAEMGTAEEVR